nr:hypothetical protein LTR18_006064 [Exophiala xenobiotica]
MELTEKFIKPADYPGTRNTDVLCGWDLTEKGSEIKIRENQTRGINQSGPVRQESRRKGATGGKGYRQTGKDVYHSHAGLIRLPQFDVHLIQKVKDSEGTYKDTTNKLRNAMQSARKEERSRKH